jgi:ribosomal protein S12 methylthiotransferase accessory factor
MTRAIRLSSSFRVLPPAETLERARIFAGRLGISRVTDITQLDSIGIPVFSSIRPNAQSGSLCVNAGKGIQAIEARVGAYMEAIEFALAESHQSAVKARLVTPRDLLDGQTRTDAVLDFCPTMNTEIELDAPIEAILAEEIISQTECLVPAELVYFPYQPQMGGRSYFGANTNGLCSGNTVFEATVHGLAEVIERDIASFEMMRDTSRLVDPESYPDHIAQLRDMIEQAGFQLFIRYSANTFNLPFFRAVIAEADLLKPLFIFGGYGCHPVPDIAITRAVCEAAQSRLTLIHGGRDDVIESFRRFENMSDQQQADYAKRFVSQLSRSDDMIRFSDICQQVTITSITDCYTKLIESLIVNGLKRVCRVIYTEPDDPVQVLRIIVPGLEFFNENSRRVGLRLRDYVKANS